MQPTLLEQGLTLMLVGMGTVFVFLTLLVAGMSLMALVVKRFLPAVIDVDVSDEDIAVITVAIAQHRKIHS
ncbi:MAG: OadG family protein [Woeseiaceae bacterium]